MAVLQFSDLLPGKLKKQLQKVNCPLLGDRSDLWLNELLFSSSRSHNEFLRWILSSFDPSLDSVSEAKVSSLSTSDQHKHLHQICSSLGLCDKENIAITNGTADKKHAMGFWENLLELHLIHVNPGSKEGSQEVSGLWELDATEGLNTSPLTTCSPKKWKILDPDVEFEVRQYARINSMQCPPKDKLIEMLEAIPSTEETKTETIQEMDLQDLHDQLVSSIKEVQGLIPQFKECHQKLKPFLTEPKPRSQLEPRVTAASENVQLLQELFGDLDLLVKPTSGLPSNLAVNDFDELEANLSTVRTIASRIMKAEKTQ